MAYDVGDVHTTTAAFLDGDGDPADPSGVTLIVRAPDGTETTPTPDNPEVGEYSHDQELDQPGVWAFEWAGTGAVTAVETQEVYVRRRRVEGS